MRSWLEKNFKEIMHSADNGEKCAAVERFIRTLKNNDEMTK